MLSDRLERIAVEYADLLAARDAAQRELKSARTRVGNKKRQMLRVAAEELVDDAELNAVVAEARSGDRTVRVVPEAPVLKCYACGGAKVDFKARVAEGAELPPCPRCSGSGFEPSGDAR